MSALFLPALCIAVILAGLLARTNVYDAFVRGAEEGLRRVCVRFFPRRRFGAKRGC